MVLEIILWIIRFFFGAGIFSILHIVIDKLTYGKSAICAKSKRIARYFLVELTGGVSMTGCAIVYGCGKMGVISLRGAVFFIYLGILFVIALVDWHIQMIYDRFHIMILILAVLDFILYPEMGNCYKTDRYGNHISADAGAGTCNSRGFRRRRYQADVGKRIAYWWRVNDMCNVYWDYNRRCLCDTDAGTKEAE